MVMGKVLARINSGQVKQEMCMDCLAVFLDGNVVKRDKLVYHGHLMMSNPVHQGLLGLGPDM